MNVQGVLNNYRVYNHGNRVVGAGDEFPLPSFDNTTYTVTGAGFLGEFEQPVVGHIKSIHGTRKAQNLQNPADFGLF